jgi:hypothetical protein
MPVLDKLLKCIKAIKDWKDKNDGNSETALHLAEKLADLDHPLKDLASVKDELSCGDERLERILADVETCEKYLYEFGNKCRLVR